METSKQSDGLLLLAAKPIRYGLLVCAIVIGFFGIWGSIAPLDSYAIAPGSVVLDSNRKTVQHLEGGIIEDLLVKEGDFVIKNQILVLLNATSAQAQQGLLTGQLAMAKANEIRLIAERDEKKHVNYDHYRKKFADYKGLDDIIKDQTLLFEKRYAANNSKFKILSQRIEQFKEQLVGLNAQIKSADERLAFISEEIVAKKQLLDKGLLKKPEYLLLQRRKSELTGLKGEYRANVARVKESISETKYQMVNLRNESSKEILDELKQVQSTIHDIEEKLSASTDVLGRTEILAPQSGRVTGLKYHTIGGVIQPGSPIMDIVPQDDMKLIEARVAVSDIDVVRKGLKAKVMLSAYKARNVPRIDGEVIDVSADRFTDESTGVPYYLARILIAPDAFDALEADVELYPGMPADVFIVTGENTLLGYLISPITDSFHRALREQ